ncbi:uncharacterized protein K460DRAFT_366985 [Cucurbitaria berberidis CBS 394.84]|uniref:Uncharacterized protein n=1 Tax=Cucurbitaria berberidis CBS 394.84 TaxID=1168544 RepID=A0A9P4GJ46_9PLEO|nr:uncharacterized protein K460DRAFT_366985 [Cucurbitaria berberidis CBS 394.84]KAF1846159.1 hypothetical protein K460DRAFT_366985 [Cucurbitaria berberidis CBS 394.84]
MGRYRGYMVDLRVAGLVTELGRTDAAGRSKYAAGTCNGFCNECRTGYDKSRGEASFPCVSCKTPLLDSNVEREAFRVVSCVVNGTSRCDR